MNFNITRGDEIVLKRELNNSYDQYAVQMLDISGHVLGYVPGYYSEGISKMLKDDKRVHAMFTMLIRLRIVMSV